MLILTMELIKITLKISINYLYFIRNKDILRKHFVNIMILFDNPLRNWINWKNFKI